MLVVDRRHVQVPEGYRFPSAPLVMDSQVVTGFGRGSRQLGVPTANMDPAPLAQQLQGLPQVRRAATCHGCSLAVHKHHCRRYLHQLARGCCPHHFCRLVKAGECSSCPLKLLLLLLPGCVFWLGAAGRTAWLAGG